VTWSFVIPGQPPSVNKSYHITEQGGIRKDGTPYTYRTLSKYKKIVDWQASAAMIIRAARPSGWKPEGFIRISIVFYVTRHIDADNTLKSLHDAIQTATGINDRWYLPCVEMMFTGVRPQDARVVVTISDL
jgi:Holliday junction resolvase RusA-like endonuclease